jgi:uncharacterized protein YcbX
VVPLSYSFISFLFSFVLSVQAPSMPTLKIPLNRSATNNTIENVGIFKDTINGEEESLEANKWFSSYLGFECQLIKVAKYTNRNFKDQKKVQRKKEKKERKKERQL